MMQFLIRFVATYVMCVVSASACVAQTAPASPASDDLQAYYHAALNAMKKLDEPAGFSFHYRLVQKFAGQESVRQADVTLRTADGIARWNERKRERRGYFFVRPDLLVSGTSTARTTADSDDAIRPLIIDASGDRPPSGNATIGRVVAYARVYTIDEVPVSVADGCADSRHLHFVSLVDPSAHNIRDLWIDRESLLVCKAVLNWNVAAISGRPSPSM